MSTLFLIGFFTLLLQLPVSGDIMVKEVRRTESYTMMGRTFPARTESVTTWISEDVIRSKGTKNDMLIRSDEGSIFLIDHEEKVYRKMPDQLFTDSMKKEMEDLPPGMAEKMRNMMKMEVKIEPTNETATINDWSCRKYKQTVKTGMASTVSNLWATKEVDISPELTASFMTAFYQSGPMGNISGNMVSEMKKVEGFVVKSTTSTEMMGTTIESSSEALEVDQNAQPPNKIYELPDGYEEVEWE